MNYGDIEGKGKIYSDSGDIILNPGERVVKTFCGMLHRGWIRYKLGWRTIMFKGYGSIDLTNKRVVYIEKPEFIEKIHTFNLDHELGDFGGWDYHAHRLRRAAALDAFMFFDLPISEITKIKHDKQLSTIFVKDAKHTYKVVVEPDAGKEIDAHWKKYFKII